MISSKELYAFLKAKKLLKNFPKWWWPNAGSFEVLVSAILTQNTTWKNVEKSLKNLEGFLEITAFSNLDEATLKEMIKPSGFYNQKAPRLLTLSNNILNEFGTFKAFQKMVSRDWLLAQKGVGEESADAILCYACLRDEMVVDSYTKRLLKKFDISFKKYGEYKDFLESDFRKEFKKTELFEIFAAFHGMIVEYNKHYKNELL
ncbi:3-methyladenine DNA glycosylase [Sulfurimonas sp.]|uniref:3-methyladenine DNA glycosylase n=1 Tax=Sulfurimonas sp. TaxID=2022749 RepID=UPI00261166EC|nr:3-methyladenine DNA glycosylase [Sulfurimonas sp.]